MKIEQFRQELTTEQLNDRLSKVFGTSINLHKFISLDFIFFSPVRDLQISRVCGPDIRTIAIPLGPFPEDNANTVSYTHLTLPTIYSV